MNYLKSKITDTIAKLTNTNNGIHPYKLTMSPEGRRLLYNKLQIDYPDKIPVITHGVNIMMSKSKFLIEPNMTVQSLINHVVLFSYMEDTTLLPSGNLILQTNNGTTLKIQDNLGDIYTNYKDSEDNLLYIWILMQ